MIAHPSLDSVDQIVRVFGYPTILGAIIWGVRKWDKGQSELKSIHENAKAAAQDCAEMKINHFPHLQSAIESVATSNDEAVKVLQNIDKGIAILTDRFPRV